MYLPGGQHRLPGIRGGPSSVSVATSVEPDLPGLLVRDGKNGQHGALLRACNGGGMGRGMGGDPRHRQHGPLLRACKTPRQPASNRP